MKGIFISYRRADSAPYAGRICDHLRRTFPSVSVFMDVEAINPGADFVKAVDANLAGSGVVLAVIGPQWESIRDGDGRARVEDPNDYVVRELATAIQRQANVIPLLVGGAQMPSAATLPPSLQELSRRNAIEMSDNRFAEDAERLCKAIAGALDLPQDDERYARAGRVQPVLLGCRAHAGAHQVSSRGLDQLCADGAVRAVRAVLDESRAPDQLRINPDDQLRRSGPRDRRAACRVRGHERHHGRRRLLFRRRWTKTLVPVVILFFGVLLLVVNVKLLRGRKWARIAFAVVGGLVALSVFDVLVVSNPLQGAPYIAQIVLHAATVVAYVWAIRMMFTEPVRRWFLRA